MTLREGLIRGWQEMTTEISTNMELYDYFSQKLNPVNFWSNLTSSLRETQFGNQRISTPMLASDIKKPDLQKLKLSLPERGYTPPAILPAKQKVTIPKGTFTEGPGNKLTTLSAAKLSPIESLTRKLPGPAQSVLQNIKEGFAGTGQINKTLEGETTYDTGLLGFLRPGGFGKPEFQKIDERVRALEEAGVNTNRAYNIALADVRNSSAGPKAADKNEGLSKVEIDALAGVRRGEIADTALGALDFTGLGSLRKQATTQVGKIAPTALEEAYKVLGPVGKDPKSKLQSLKDALTWVQTSFTSQFTPLRKAEQQIYKVAGIERPRLDLARKFEQVAGAPAKAEADIIRFKNLVVDPIKNNYDDFNALLFLKRTRDRLEHDFDPTVSRKVGNWTIERTREGIQQLRIKLGEDLFNKLDTVSTAQFQISMDKALNLQVAAGRMAPELYEAIKKSNDFYAPFKVMKYTEELESGAARGIATTQELTKKITGIYDEDFQIGDILQRSAEIIYRSRILAEKNLKMLELADLGKIDAQGLYVKALKEGDTAPKGFEKVSYFRNGTKESLAVTREIADALSGGQASRGLVSKALAGIAVPFRWGATTANAAFQIVNLLFADLPRLAIISRYGLKDPLDAVRFPMDMAYAFFTSMTGNFGKPNKLFMQWLESGAANSTIQRELTPEAFIPKFVKLKPRTVAGSVVKVARNFTIDAVAGFANAIEETAKIAGFKRAMRIEGIDKLPPTEAAKKMQEIVTEIRNYSGSPDFFRKGTVSTEKNGISMNVLFMFFNARIQGAAADFARLAGATGGKDAGVAWARLATIIGTPAVTLAMLNNSAEYRDDYLAIPEEERRNYFMVPRNVFFFTDDGQRVRDYWRIPKREIVKLFSNLLEGAVEFGRTADPTRLDDLAIDFLEDISPISVQGNSFSERVESTVSSMNPLFKAPVELGLGRNTYFHQDTVPERLKNVSPELQYKKNTPEFFKFMGEKLGWSPLMIEQAVQSSTAGLFTQFIPPANNQDRTIVSQLPGLKRFVRSRTVNETVQQGRINEFLTSQADETVTLQREAEALHARLSSMSSAAANTEAKRIKKENPRLFAELKDVVEQDKLGLSYNDRLIRMLQVRNGQRAQFIYQELQMLPDDNARNAYIAELREKKLISTEVFQQLKHLKETSEI